MSELDDRIFRVYLSTTDALGIGDVFHFDLKMNYDEEDQYKVGMLIGIYRSLCTLVGKDNIPRWMNSKNHRFNLLTAKQLISSGNIQHVYEYLLMERNNGDFS